MGEIIRLLEEREEIIKTLLSSARCLIGNRIAKCSCTVEDRCWQCKHELELDEQIVNFLEKNKNDNKLRKTTKSGKQMTEENKNENQSKGWICPKCGRANGPHVNQCPCSDNGGYYPRSFYPMPFPFPYYPQTTSPNWWDRYTICTCYSGNDINAKT